MEYGLLNVQVLNQVSSRSQNRDIIPRSQSTMMNVAAAVLFLSLNLIGTQAFVSPKVSALTHITLKEPNPSQQKHHHHHHHHQPTNSFRVTPSSANMLQTRPTRLSLRRYMYSLPPSGGGGNKNDLEGILTGLGAVAAIALFFASPLGTLFFAITNSLFLLTLMLPILAIVGFQAWQFLYTMEGPCPNCGAPVRVLKEDEQPTLCLSCGTLVQPKKRGDSINIEVFDGGSAIYDEMEEDGFFGGSAGSILDSIWNQAASERQGQQQQQQKQQGAPLGGKSTTSKASQYRRERTVIDVDAEEE